MDLTVFPPLIWPAFGGGGQNLILYSHSYTYSRGNSWTIEVYVNTFKGGLCKEIFSTSKAPWSSWWQANLVGNYCCLLRVVLGFKTKKHLWSLCKIRVNVRQWCCCPQIPQRTASIATALNTNLTSGIRHPVRARYWTQPNDLIRHFLELVPPKWW